jgi:hypothetical protein
MTEKLLRRKLGSFSPTPPSGKRVSFRLSRRATIPLNRDGRKPFLVMNVLFYSATFEERCEEQVEISTYCDEIFGSKEFLTLDDFSNLIKTTTSEMFLSVRTLGLKIDHVYLARQATLLELFLQKKDTVQIKEWAWTLGWSPYSTDCLTCYDQEEE